MVKVSTAQKGGSSPRAHAVQRQRTVERRALRKARSIKNRLVAWAGTESRTPLTKAQMFALLDHARELMRPRHRGQVYGAITAKQFFVYEALVRYAYAHDGRCDRCYAWIAAAARCSKPTVATALDVLEGLGLLTRIRRIVRRGMKGVVSGITETLVHRVANAYTFPLGQLPRPADQPNLRGITWVERNQPINSHARRVRARIDQEALIQHELALNEAAFPDRLSPPTGNPTLEEKSTISWRTGMNIALHPAFATVPDAARAERAPFGRSGGGWNRW